MQLTHEALEEFHNMLREDYPDRSFSSAEVRELAESTLNVFKHVYRQIPHEKEAMFGQLLGETVSVTGSSASSPEK